MKTQGERNMRRKKKEQEREKMGQLEKMRGRERKKTENGEH